MHAEEAITTIPHNASLPNLKHEPLVVKVLSILGGGPASTAGMPSHEPRAAHRAHAQQTKMEREMVLARYFEKSSCPSPVVA